MLCYIGVGRFFFVFDLKKSRISSLAKTDFIFNYIVATLHKYRLESEHHNLKDHIHYNKMHVVYYDHIKTQVDFYHK